MIRKSISKKRQCFFILTSLAILLSGYSVLSHMQHLRNPKDTTMPALISMYDIGRMLPFVEFDNKNKATFARGITKSVTPQGLRKEIWLFKDSKATFIRLGTGLAGGVFFGVIIGFLMGCFRSMDAFFTMPMRVLSKIPPTAAMAIFFVLLGTSLKMYAGVIMFGIVPTLAVSIYFAIKDVPDQFIYKAYTVGASTPEVMWNVIFREILPKIIDAVRLAIGPSLVFLIAAEMYSADVGFGYRIRLQSRMLNMEVVYPYLLLLGLFGLFADWMFVTTRKKLCPWYGDLKQIKDRKEASNAV